LDAVAVVEPSARQLPAAHAVHEDADVKAVPPLEKVPAGHRFVAFVAEPVPAGQK
jgi:adenosine/AMP kinase